MWRELILETTDDVECGPPATEQALAAVVATLGQRLPRDLAELLRECDGVRGRHGRDVVWSAERITRVNREFRSYPDFPDLYMPFEPLMFFGAGDGGDQFAFVRTPERDDVFVWDHETDSRAMVTGSLHQYLLRALREGGDWFRND
ncbi:SMI1/KNR4 family protein [Kitasatospora sp. LaBMicrA B282]|uniref:SMI1/KNR4 family protein n=1 Tax=Kitasatospora sp. LaBMicrA B282 TaxID=3420949 RepID=UPI003D0CA728